MHLVRYETVDRCGPATFRLDSRLYPHREEPATGTALTLAYWVSHEAWIKDIDGRCSDEAVRRTLCDQLLALKAQQEAEPWNYPDPDADLRWELSLRFSPLVVTHDEDGVLLEPDMFRHRYFYNLVRLRDLVTAAPHEFPLLVEFDAEFVMSTLSRLLMSIRLCDAVELDFILRHGLPEDDE